MYFQVPQHYGQYSKPVWMTTSFIIGFIGGIFVDYVHLAIVELPIQIVLRSPALFGAPVEMQLLRLKDVTNFSADADGWLLSLHRLGDPHKHGQAHVNN